MLTYLVFTLFVALAVYAQTVTGFAMTLILLGLVGLIDLVPLSDAVNVVTVLLVVNAAMYFYRRKEARVEPLVVPAVVMSLLGVFVGMALLTFLAANAYQVLRMLLGLSIVICALLLLRASTPYEKTAGKGYFAWAGLISGVLGGLFAAPGPPLVYAVYRQPWPIERIQESLLFCFGVSSLLRLVIVVSAGEFSQQALMLTIGAIPVTLLVTSLSVSYPPSASVKRIKNVVSILLIGSGLGMLVSSVYVMFA